MTLARYEHTGAAAPTGLASGINSSATSFTTLSGTGYPTGAVGDFVIDIDAGTATEEKILCSARSGTSFTVASGGRGYDGTTAQAHSTGTTNVTHVFAAAEADDDSRHIYGNSGTPSDDHTNYALLSGARPFTGNVTIDANLTVTGTINGGGGGGSGAGSVRLQASGASANNPTGAVMAGGSAAIDTNSGYSAGTGEYTVPTAGDYLVASTVNGFASSSYVMDFGVKHNGTVVGYLEGSFDGTGSGQPSGSVQGIVTCAIGDTLGVWASVSGAALAAVTSFMATNLS
jgi:hypothetical protein